MSRVIETLIIKNPLTEVIFTYQAIEVDDSTFKIICLDESYKLKHEWSAETLSHAYELMYRDALAWALAELEDFGYSSAASRGQ